MQKCSSLLLHTCYVKYTIQTASMILQEEQWTALSELCIMLDESALLYVLPVHLHASSPPVHLHKPGCWDAAVSSCAWTLLWPAVSAPLFPGPLRTKTQTLAPQSSTEEMQRKSKFNYIDNFREDSMTVLSSHAIYAFCRSTRLGRIKYSGPNCEIH